VNRALKLSVLVPVVVGWVGPLAPFFQDVTGGAVLWTVLCLASLSAVLCALTKHYKRSVPGLLIVLALIISTTVLPKSDPSLDIEVVAVSAPVSDVTTAPPASEVKPARATATFMPPQLELTPRGVGGPNTPIPVILRGTVRNIGPEAVSIVTILLDTDARPRIAYAFDRYRLEPGETQDLSFQAWIPGACYQPMVAVALTHQGSDLLAAWLAESGRARHG
jgi:hypothetical protein